LPTQPSYFKQNSKRRREYTFTSEFRRSRDSSRQLLVEHFKSSISKAQTNWLLEHRVIILTTHENYNYAHPSGIDAHINHALLKEICFFKAMDPATLHMRLSSFISGVLPSIRKTTTLSDKDKIRKAGFDTVTSFRKASTKRQKH
jgi:hypothetical protein